MNRDWKCTDCGNMVFGSKRECGKCGKWRPRDTRQGDWHCTCGEMNFASRQTCRKCNASCQESKTNPKPRAGDWLCACKEMNFGSRVNCFKCGNPRDPEETIHGGDGKCGVCFAQEANVCITTCGHIAMCFVCASGLKMCPVCRKAYNPTKDLVRTYKAV